MHPIAESYKLLIDTIRADSKDEFKKAASFFFRKINRTGSPGLTTEKLKIFLPLYLKAKKLLRDLNLPREVENALKHYYLFNYQNNAVIEQSAMELAEHFNSSKIRLILLKGAALLTTVYQKDIGVRMMDDIDILIEKSN